MDNQQDESEPCSVGLEVRHCLMRCFIASPWDGGQAGTPTPGLLPSPQDLVPGSSALRCSCLTTSCSNLYQAFPLHPCSSWLNRMLLHVPLETLLTVVLSNTWSLQRSRLAPSRPASPGLILAPRGSIQHCLFSDACTSVSRVPVCFSPSASVFPSKTVEHKLW